MNRKTVKNIAILIGLVFLITVVVYPLIYSPDPPQDPVEDISTPAPVEP